MKFKKFTVQKLLSICGAFLVKGALVFFFVQGAWANSLFCPEFQMKDLFCHEKRTTLQGEESIYEFSLSEISMLPLNPKSYQFYQNREDQPPVQTLVPGQMEYKSFQRSYTCSMGLLNGQDALKSGASTSRALKVLPSPQEGIEVFGWAFVTFPGHKEETIVRIYRKCTHDPQTARVGKDPLEGLYPFELFF